MTDTGGLRGWANARFPALGASIALVVCVAAGFWFSASYAPGRRRAALEGWERDLGTRAEVRREALKRYFVDGLADAETFTVYPAVLQALGPESGAAGDRQAAAEAQRVHLGEIFDGYVKTHGIAGAVLWDTGGTALVKSRNFEVDPACAAFVQSTVAAQPAVGLHRHAGADAILTFSAPVRDATGNVRGRVVLAEDPGMWLYPLLSRPLAGTSSGEALLAARDGADALYLSPLRGRPDPPLTFRRPLDGPDFAARKALEAPEVFGSFVDYRGIRVLAAGRRVPPSPWALVVKIDEAEAMAEVDSRIRRTGLALTGVLAAALALVGGLLHKRDRDQTRALAEGEVRLMTILDQANDAILIAAPDGRIRFLNRACEAIYGSPVEALRGRALADFRVGDQREAALARLDETLRLGQIVFESEHVRADGSRFPVEVSARVVEIAGEKLIVSVNRDITERRHLESQLQQAQKMEAVGRLAGGVAHDFNNLLTVIQGYGELLQASLADDPEKRESVGEIVKAAERAAALTRQLLAFSRRQVLEMRVLDLGAVVADTEKMLKRLIGEDVEVAVVRAAALGRVKADPGQIGQVVLNLAVNARDAMPGGGRLTLTLADADLDAPLAAVPEAIPAGRYVLLSIADTGIGMTGETLSHVFEPFFTTKEKGRGTGLGLATVYGIVRQTGGYVAVETAPGAGTTFRIYLPRCPDPMASGIRAAIASRRGTETILLVEDEPAVRNLVLAVLERSGYTVRVAQDGPAALDLVTNDPRPLHVLLTDLVMPGMNGRDLAARVAELRPGIRIVFMSGYSADVATDFAENPAFGFLAKPFTERALTVKIREVLDAPLA